MEYYHALNAAQTKGAYGALEQFFLEEQSEYKTLAEGFVVPIERTSKRRQKEPDQEQ